MEILLKSPQLLATLKILLILIVALLLNTVLRSSIKIPHKLDTRRGRTYVSVVRSFISIIILVITLNIILVILGIDIGPLLASAGIVGLAVGIGARSFFEDIISGVFLLTQTTTAVGDQVIIGTTEGTIIDISFRNMTLRGANGSLIIIPNSQVKQVINASWGNAVLFIDIPVKGGQHIDKITQLLTGILTEMKEDKKRKYPVKEDSTVLGVDAIQQGNCILLKIKILTTPSGRHKIDREYREKVVKAFEKQKLEFA